MAIDGGTWLAQRVVAVQGTNGTVEAAAAAVAAAAVVTPRKAPISSRGRGKGRGSRGERGRGRGHCMAHQSYSEGFNKAPGSCMCKHPARQTGLADLRRQQMAKARKHACFTERWEVV